MIKKISFILLVLSLIISIFCLTYCVYLLKDIESIKQANQESNNYHLIYDISISKQEYYDNYLFTDGNHESLVENLNEYYIYFHQEGCSACHDADPIINEYVISDKQKQVPIFFAIPGLDKGLFEEYNIESTPSLVIIKNNTSRLINDYNDIKNELR